MTLTKTLIAAAVALCAVQAQALTWSVTAGSYSTQAGARHDTFDGVATDANEALDLAHAGGRLFSASIGGITARPPGSVGNFLSVGISGGQSGPIIVDLATAPADYYGFLWGSPDRYNSVEFYDDETLLKSLSGADVFANPNPANGFQGAFSNGQYFNAFAGNAEQITRVVFRSAGNAFETDNHAVMAVPEPGSHALMLAGLGVMGLVARRRTTG
ncbi:MAG: PEP-CTERM sorting domain-containing protein [Burkholderiaceae bacterium]|nr:PEP-CTERM sorting domain-containing protein [Burkholderiaceae bacterium]